MLATLKFGRPVFPYSCEKSSSHSSKIASTCFLNNSARNLLAGISTIGEAGFQHRTRTVGDLSSYTCQTIAYSSKLGQLLLRNHLYNSARDLWDDDLAAYLNQLKYDKMLIILEPCFSGGFLADLRGKRRVIVSASSEYEYSWGGGPGNHDMFSYHFTAALAGQTHDGTPVNADANNDAKISALEAFNYAAAQDTQPENPFYADSVDGRGHKGGPFSIDGDGTFGAALDLD